MPKADGPVMLTPKRRQVLTTSAELSPSATCRETGCTWPAVIEKPHALASAMDHAQDTGHAVTVDTVNRAVVIAK
jgi:hypothetical protein